MFHLQLSSTYPYNIKDTNNPDSDTVKNFDTRYAPSWIRPIISTCAWELIFLWNTFFSLLLMHFKAIWLSPHRLELFQIIIHDFAMILTFFVSFSCRRVVKVLRIVKRYRGRKVPRRVIKKLKRRVRKLPRRVRKVCKRVIRKIVRHRRVPRTFRRQIHRIRKVVRRVVRRPRRRPRHTRVVRR